MTIEVLSFTLAIGVGVICWALIKYSADEFERSYDVVRTSTAVRQSTGLGGAIMMIAAVLVAFVR